MVSLALGYCVGDSGLARKKSSPFVSGEGSGKKSTSKMDDRLSSHVF